MALSNDWKGDQYISCYVLTQPGSTPEVVGGYKARENGSINEVHTAHFSSVNPLSHSQVR